MRFNKFDMNLLVVLDALLTERNITRAGERLFLSQSATSGALARLREYFDDQLLVRIGRKMVLTPLAENLAMPVRRLLIQARTTLETHLDLDPAQIEGKLSFVMSDYTSMVVMPEVIRRAAEIAPGVSFEIIYPGDNPTAELDQGNIDFLLIPGIFLTDEHPRQELFTETFVCICDEGNSDVQDGITAEQYMKFGHISVGFGSRSTPGIDSVLTEQAGISRRVDVTVNAYSQVPQYVIGTTRIATVHKRLADFWAQFLPIRVVQPGFELATIPWCLQWHQYRDLDPLTLWIKELMMETMDGA